MSGFASLYLTYINLSGGCVVFQQTVYRGDSGTRAYMDVFTACGETLLNIHYVILNPV